MRVVQRGRRRNLPCPCPSCCRAVVGRAAGMAAGIFWDQSAGEIQEHPIALLCCLWCWGNAPALPMQGLCWSSKYPHSSWSPECPPTWGSANLWAHSPPAARLRLCSHGKPIVLCSCYQADHPVKDIPSLSGLGSGCPPRIKMPLPVPLYRCPEILLQAQAAIRRRVVQPYCSFIIRRTYVHWCHTEWNVRTHQGLCKHPLPALPAGGCQTRGAAGHGCRMRSQGGCRIRICWVETSFLIPGGFHAPSVPQPPAQMKYYAVQEPLHRINQGKEAWTKPFLYSCPTAPLLHRVNATN